MNSDNIEIKVIISGKVQGVFYRAETKKAADKLNIKGYVKNLSDGSVEAVFNADQSKINHMIKWCHKGPAASRVDNILTQRIEQSENFDTFEIRY
ncbi:MAG: acylphosphatase [Thermodesulfobacteriota bacterium]